MGVNVVNNMIRSHINADLAGPEWTAVDHLASQNVDEESPVFGQGAYKTLKAAAIAQGQTQSGFDTVASGIGGGGSGTFGAWYAGRSIAWKAQAWRLWKLHGEV